MKAGRGGTGESRKREGSLRSSRFLSESVGGARKREGEKSGGKSGRGEG